MTLKRGWGVGISDVVVCSLELIRTKEYVTRKRKATKFLKEDAKVDARTGGEWTISFPCSTTDYHIKRVIHAEQDKKLLILCVGMNRLFGSRDNGAPLELGPPSSNFRSGPGGLLLSAWKQADKVPNYNIELDFTSLAMRCPATCRSDHQHNKMYNNFLTNSIYFSEIFTRFSLNFGIFYRFHIVKHHSFLLVS